MPTTLARFLSLPENRVARTAVDLIREAFRTETTNRLPMPVKLHGPGGTGKTHLAAGLIRELTRNHPHLMLRLVAGNDLKLALRSQRERDDASRAESSGDFSIEPNWLTEARDADFLVVEDVHHVPDRAAETMVQLLDDRQAHQRPTLLTARFGPRQLATSTRLGARLLSRLSGGLVIALESLQAGSRLQLLHEFAQRRQLAVPPEILEWLAVHLTGGGRQLEGAIAQLDTLSKIQKQPLRLADVRPHFRAQVDALRPSVERIVERVGSHFGLTRDEMSSRRRLHCVLVPRQISMYLARRLTGLSLQEIGAALGGHDHTTVLHACRKIESAVHDDALLSGTVQQLQAELT